MIVTKLLLSAGINIDEVYEAESSTLLHIAVSNGNQTIVSKLLEHGAKVESINQAKETPLIITKSCAITSEINATSPLTHRHATRTMMPRKNGTPAPR